MLKLEVDRTAVEHGEELAGRLRWSEVPKGTETLEIRLIWHTSGKGDRDHEVVQLHRVVAPAIEGECEFRFIAPFYPPSFSGKLVSLVWMIEAIAFPALQAEQQVVVIGPRAMEIRLDHPVAEPSATVRDQPLQGQYDG